MTAISFLLGTLIALIGVFMTGAELRACAYERNNIGPWLVFLGLIIVAGGVVELVLS